MRSTQDGRPDPSLAAPNQSAQRFDSTLRISLRRFWKETRNKWNASLWAVGKRSTSVIEMLLCNVGSTNTSTSNEWLWSVRLLYSKKKKKVGAFGVCKKSLLRVAQKEFAGQLKGKMINWNHKSNDFSFVWRSQSHARNPRFDFRKSFSWKSSLLTESLI